MNIDEQKAVIDRLSKVLGYVELAKDSLQKDGYLSEMEVKISLDAVVKKVKENIAIHEGHVAKWSTYPVKSAQRRRDEIVEQAKRDIEGLKGDDGNYGVRLSIHRLKCKADFIVNKEKRTVVVLLRGFSTGEVIDRGIAKCAPNDCFNSHIGKAIALRRALGLEVPAEYLNAPQPTEVRVGDVVTFPGGINKRVLYRVDDTEKKEDNLTIVRCDVAPSLVGKKANADFTNRDSMLPVVDDSRE